MSYDIFYKKQFIKVSNTQVIPFIEMGSNNLWESDNNRRVRSWCNCRANTDGQIIVDNTTLLANIEAYRERLIERNKDRTDTVYEDKSFGWFTAISMYGKSTATTTFNDYNNIYKSGIKGALTIEQLSELCGVGIRIHVYCSDEKKIKENGFEVKPDVYFESTEHMLDTIKEYTEYYTGVNECTVYILGYSGSMDRLFEKKRMQNLIAKSAKRKAKTPVTVDAFYVLEAIVHTIPAYLIKNIKNGFRYSHYASNGYTKKFVTEKEANTYLKRLKNKEKFTVKKIEEKMTFNK